MNIIITAYRPNGFDTCRGCLMDQSDSDFQYVATTCRQEAVNFLYEIYKNDFHDIENREVCKYEIQIFVDGIHSYGEDYDDMYGEFALELISDAKLKTEKYIKEENERREEKVKLQKEKEQEAIRNSELMLLQTLKSKYE